MTASDHRAHHPSAHPAHHGAVGQAEWVLRSFRRIAWQRIEVGPGGHGRGLVTGLRHRLPTTIEVTLETAHELRRRGVRTVVHRGAGRGAGGAA